MILYGALDAFGNGADARAIFDDDVDGDSDTISFDQHIDARMGIAGNQFGKTVGQAFTRHANHAIALVDMVADNADDGTGSHVDCAK